MMANMLAIACGRFVQIDPDTIAAPHPIRDQRVGQLVGQSLEFAVGDALIAQPNGFVIRLPGGAFRKEVMKSKGHKVYL